jgi:hypothetical protein
VLLGFTALGMFLFWMGMIMSMESISALGLGCGYLIFWIFLFSGVYLRRYSLRWWSNWVALVVQAYSLCYLVLWFSSRNYFVSPSLFAVSLIVYPISIYIAHW